MNRSKEGVTYIVSYIKRYDFIPEELKKLEKINDYVELVNVIKITDFYYGYIVKIINQD